MFVHPVSPILITGICVFCLQDETRGTPCTYGLAHEYPQREKPKQQAKRDTRICLKCSLHVLNPASAKSECAHLYAPEVVIRESES